MVNKAIELYHQGHWAESADMLEKSINHLRADQHDLTYLGLNYMKIGEYDRAIAVFEKLQLPISSLAALDWAGFLCAEKKYDKALKVISKTNRNIRQGSMEEMIAADRCILLRDIIFILTGSEDLESMELKKRDRLLRLVYPGVYLFTATYRMFGWIFNKLKLYNGETILKFVRNFLYNCWAYGFQVTPDFLEDVCLLEKMEGYKASHDVYRRIFLSYLEYWINSKEDICDLLLASVKPADAHALYCLVREKQPSVILEVGTFAGFSTCLMAQAVKDNGKGKIYCIDPNIKHLSVKSPLLHATRMHKILKLDKYIEIHEGFFSAPRENLDSNTPVLGKNISQIIPPIDMAFIDGDHATTAVLQDFMLVLPHLQKKSTVIFHDIKSCHSVRQGILTLFQDCIFRSLFRYFEISPSAIDGIGFIDINKERRIVKEGIDKLISKGIN